MDLFGDLPEPSSKAKDIKQAHTIVTGTVEPCIKAASKSFNLFDDLPETSQSLNIKDNVLKRKNDSPSESQQQICEKKMAIDLLELNGFHAERKGEREDMQDAHVMLANFTDQIDELNSSVYRLAYFAVFDGHAGARASKHAATDLHKTLAVKFPRGDMKKIEADIKRCLVETYKKTDEDFLRQASKSKPSWKDGTTATTVIAINNTLYIANLGDSKAVLCRYNEQDKKCHGISLTKDHNPQDFNERMRIQKAGGQVKNGRVMGVLEVSRSIGDGPYKNHGVSSIPDVKRCQLISNDRWLLIACDGLWKTFTNETALTFVNQILEDKSIVGTELKSAAEARWEMAAQRLASEAVRRLSADNVTVVLIQISSKDSQTEKQS